MIHLLLDMSCLAYGAAYKLQSLSYQGKQTGAVFSVLRTIHKLVETYDPEQVVAVFDGGSTARTKFFPAYKEGRHEDEYKQAMRAAVKDQLESLKIIIRALPIISVWWAGIEADDIFYILKKYCIKGEIGIVTADGDLNQLHDERTFIIDPNTYVAKQLTESGTYYLLEKILTGCKTDKIPGIPRVGEVTAGHLIREAGERLEAISAFIKERGGIGTATANEALEIIARNEQLITLGKLLMPQETRAIIDSYTFHAPRPLTIEAQRFDGYLERFGIKSIRAGLKSFLLAFKRLERCAHADSTDQEYTEDKGNNEHGKRASNRPTIRRTRNVQELKRPIKLCKRRAVRRIRKEALISDAIATPRGSSLRRAVPADNGKKWMARADRVYQAIINKPEVCDRQQARFRETVFFLSSLTAGPLKEIKQYLSHDEAWEACLLLTKITKIGQATKEQYMRAKEIYNTWLSAMPKWMQVERERQHAKKNFPSNTNKKPHV